MIKALLDIDYQIFIFLNSFHSKFGDACMLAITNRFTWIPMYILLIVYIVKTNAKKYYLVILGIIVSIGLADFITSSLMKPFFERLRPCYDPKLTGIVNIIGNCGGEYGFASSHAANSVALFTFVLFYYKWKNRWTKILLFWAIVVSYSRIYVGVHFLSDVLVGMFVGFCTSLLIYTSISTKLFKK